MKINKKLIALLLVFTSNLIISADLKDADLEILKNKKVAKIQETQTSLDDQYKELFEAKLAALGKKSIIGDEIKTTKVKSFLTDLSQFSKAQKTAFYKYLTNQDLKTSFLRNAFGKDYDTKVQPQLTDLELFRRFLPTDREAEIETSKSSSNSAKSTILDSWVSAQKKLIKQEGLHKAATKDFNDFVSESLLPDYEGKTLKLSSNIEKAVDGAVVEENLLKIKAIKKEFSEIEKIVFSKFDSKELDDTPPRQGVRSVDEIINTPKKLSNLLDSLYTKIIQTLRSANLKLQEVKLVEAKKLKEAEEAAAELITTNRVKQRRLLAELETEAAEAEKAKTLAKPEAKAKAKEDKSVEKRLNAAIAETDQAAETAQAGLVKSAAGAKTKSEPAETTKTRRVQFQELAAELSAALKETSAELSAVAAKTKAGAQARFAKAQAAFKAFTSKSSTRSNSPQPTRSTSPQPTRSTSPQRASIVGK
jgi:hypothetical protein